MGNTQDRRLDILGFVLQCGVFRFEMGIMAVSFAHMLFKQRLCQYVKCMYPFTLMLCLWIPPGWLLVGLQHSAGIAAEALAVLPRLVFLRSGWR